MKRKLIFFIISISFASLLFSGASDAYFTKRFWCGYRLHLTSEEAVEVANSFQDCRSKESLGAYIDSLIPALHKNTDKSFTAKDITESIIIYGQQKLAEELRSKAGTYDTVLDLSNNHNYIGVIGGYSCK